MASSTLGQQFSAVYEMEIELTHSSLQHQESTVTVLVKSLKNQKSQLTKQENV